MPDHETDEVQNFTLIAGDTADSTPPLPTASADLPATFGRYVRGEKIARGGMGAVYRAMDTVLGREVAVKVLLADHGPLSSVAERFMAEARITAHLQQPAIPPVYDLGTLPDGRPFLAMKLIDGETLDALLAARPDLATDRGRFVAVFEQVCQAIAFAHDRRVIHRDLKPSNVMVGNFGEVQIVDWGLAKVLWTADGAAPESGTEAPRIHPPGEDPLQTQAGHAVGTLAYMPPEQAQGAFSKNTPRSDVFGLGAVLAVILTGKPPFVGSASGAAWNKAVEGNLTECFARLDASGADAALVALCKWCLDPDPDKRPADASEVARAVATFRAAADERARRAELERAKAEVHAAEQRKRRKVQLALLAAVLALVTGGGAVAWWQDRQAGERKLAAERATAEHERAGGERKATEARLEAQQHFNAQQARGAVRAGLALAADLREQHKFKQAGAALAQAAALAKGSAPELLPEIEQARHDLAFVAQLDDIRYRKWVWVAEPGGQSRFNTKMAAPEYRRAFAARGLYLLILDPADAAAQIASSRVKDALVTAVDDWAVYEPDEAVRNRLLDVARRADPGPWTDRLRDPAVRGDKAALAKLAAEADPATLSAMNLFVLAEVMRENRLDPAPLLTTARVKHPADFDLAFAHGRNSKFDQQIGPYETARALRPDNQAVWINLGVALTNNGDVDGAIAAYKEAIERDPTFAQTHTNLGAALRAKGNTGGAIAAYREAIKHDPTDAYAHNNLGNALKAKGDVDGAIAAFKEAATHDPADAAIHANLGNALMDKGDVDGAIAAFRGAVKHDPTFATAHNNLGVALRAKGDTDGAVAAYKAAIKHDQTFASAHNNLGVALASKGDVDGAIAAFKDAVKHDPRDANAQTNLRVALANKERIEAAVATAADAVKRAPTDASAYTNLGLALVEKQDLDRAADAFKEAVRHNPKLVAAHTNLGAVYLQQKKYQDAITCARAAIEVNPKTAVAHALLGDALALTGDVPGARAALAEAARLDPRWAPRLAKLPPVEAAPAPREVKP